MDEPKKPAADRTESDPQPRPAVPTLEDVAARAGVSTATVSRCLNFPQRVSQSTRDNVMTSIRDLGYTPNFSARALAAKRTNTFGAIVPTMENAIFARGLQAFQEELGLHGITLLVASSSYRPELEAEQVRALVARGADALLLIGYDRSAQIYEFLENRQIPYVVAWAVDRSTPHPFVGFDNRRAMKLLAERVIECGHRKLGYITARQAGNDRARERYEGVVDAMRDNGLDPSDLSIVETSYSIENGASALKELMQGPARPTAVLCGNDVLAAGAIRMAKELGLQVPGQLSITGFDDIEIADIVAPALTTVHVPHRAMGRGAAKLLIALQNGEREEKHNELDTFIKWRDSLGPIVSAVQPD